MIVGIIDSDQYLYGIYRPRAQAPIWQPGTITGIHGDQARSESPFSVPNLAH